MVTTAPPPKTSTKSSTATSTMTTTTMTTTMTTTTTTTKTLEASRNQQRIVTFTTQNQSYPANVRRLSLLKRRHR